MRLVIVQGAVSGGQDTGGTALPALPQRQCVPVTAITGVSLGLQYKDSANKIINAQTIVLQVAGGTGVPVALNSNPASASNQAQMVAIYTQLLTDLGDDTKLTVVRDVVQLT
ncbi:MAG TPA: hypothetical protein VGF39_11535 [Stellaceae bacterium]|jgi:hypothetical protein